jgi:transglutaminase-like putative cysteine protease
MRAAARRRKNVSARTPFFTVWDRIVLRTLAVNVLVVAVLLARWPATSFAALATRGDWFLEGRTGAAATIARPLLFRTAGGLEWLYRAAHGNPYDRFLVRTTSTDARPSPVPMPMPVPVSLAGGDVGPTGRSEDAAGRRLADGTPVWPVPARLHPLVASLPGDAEASIGSVARYIRQEEPDPWLRVKALHDYVADRVSYDAEAYFSKTYPPQDAETVFRTRRSVCAGYANLMAALGAAAGEEIVVVGGDARTDGGDLTGEGHAWNAARIGGRWILLDATWDAGFLKEGRFVKRYSTEFLFTPPEVQGVSHFPEEPQWQLREPPLSRGEFLRQPLMRPRFYADGFTLVSPDRPQVTVDRVLEASLRNPGGRFVLAHFERRDGTMRADCDVEQGAAVSVRCPLPDRGTYRVVLFANAERYGTYHEVGQIEALRAEGP